MSPQWSRQCRPRMHNVNVKQGDIPARVIAHSAATSLSFWHLGTCPHTHSSGVRTGEAYQSCIENVGRSGAQPPRKGGSGRSPPEMFWNFGVSWRDLKHFYSKLHLVGLQFSRVILLHIRFSSTAITYRSFKALKYLALELLSLVLVRYPLGIELRPRQWFRFFQSLIWHAAFFIVLEPPCRIRLRYTVFIG